MPAYKDEKQNTWYCQFYYEDWQGNKKKKQKRGFKTKKEALEWERNYKLSANANMDMTMGAFIEIYFRDKAGELKERLRRMLGGTVAKMEQLFSRSQSRSTNVATFLALLELVRGGRVTLGPKGELTMQRGRLPREKAKEEE